MKKITILIFLFHNIYASYTPRIVQRPCHRRYTDQDYRKEIGNKYLEEIKNKRRAKSAPISKRLSTQTSVERAQELSQSLMIKSILPVLYHPPKIGYFEILPKQ